MRRYLPPLCYLFLCPWSTYTLSALSCVLVSHFSALVSLCQQSRYTLSTPSCFRNADSWQQIYFICSCVLVSAKQIHFICSFIVSWQQIPLCQQSRYTLSTPSFVRNADSWQQILYLLMSLCPQSRYTLSAPSCVSWQRIHFIYSFIWQKCWQLTADTLYLLMSLCPQSRYTFCAPSCVSWQRIHLCPCASKADTLYLLLHVSEMLTADSRYTLSAHVLVSAKQIHFLCSFMCRLTADFFQQLV